MLQCRYNYRHHHSFTLWLWKTFLVKLSTQHMRTLAWLGLFAMLMIFIAPSISSHISKNNSNNKEMTMDMPMSVEHAEHMAMMSHMPEESPPAGHDMADTASGACFDSSRLLQPVTPQPAADGPDTCGAVPVCSMRAPYYFSYLPRYYSGHFPILPNTCPTVIYSLSTIILIYMPYLLRQGLLRLK